MLKGGWGHNTASIDLAGGIPPNLSMRGAKQADRIGSAVEDLERVDRAHEVETPIVLERRPVFLRVRERLRFARGIQDVRLDKLRPSVVVLLSEDIWIYEMCVCIYIYHTTGV